MIYSIQNAITGNLMTTQDRLVIIKYIESYLKNQIPFNVNYGVKM